MSETQTMQPPLVPGRECGSCNVCCVALTINEPQLLQKVQGIRCKHNQADNLCAIYDSRPDTCRTFFCGFRQLRWVRDTLRPDRSGVLVRLQNERPDTTGRHRIGVIFTLLTQAALKAEGLLESIAAGIAAEVPVYLSLPGPPGYTSSLARINEVLAEAVVTKDKAAMMRILREARAKGRGGKRDPISFKTRTG